MKTYLDNNATTKPLDEISEVFIKCFDQQYANPSSTHYAGLSIRKSVEEARFTISKLINASSPDEIVFTSGGTESITHSFYSILKSFEAETVSIAISKVEHIAVLETAASYKKKLDSLISLNVNNKGQLDLHELTSVLAEKKPVFVSLMLANNETGVIFPINDICEICRKYGVLLHIDAVQAVGKFPINVQENKCNYLSISGHKFHGPKGIGALYIKNGSPRRSLIKGHQENGNRGGTENVPGILGMAVAAKSVEKNLQNDLKLISHLRDNLESMILDSVPGSTVNGDAKNRLCNTTNILFPNKDAAMLVERLSASGIFVSAGAACTTGGEPSHVLQAMGLSPEEANSSLRFSLSKYNTKEEIEIAGEQISKIINSSLDVFLS